MKTDYITSSSTLPPYLAFPRFLLNMDLRLSTKEIYAILLDIVLNSESDVFSDKRGRLYLAFRNKTIASMIDRTPATVAHALIELENAGLLERRLIERSEPYHIYLKLPSGEGEA